MSDLKVEGPGLKKLFKLARKNPLPFAFNPSTDIPKCYLAMHRKKSAKILGKDAKEEGEGAKAAFGTIKVEKKLLILQCDRVVPNLAKTLKKYLKLQKIVLNIEVRDENGQTLDADIEENIPDDPELEGDDDEPTIDKSALAKRLTDLKKRIQQLDPKTAEKLTGPYAKVVSFLKADELERCEKGLDQIEAALPKPGGKPKPDPALLKLAEMHKQLSERAKTIADEKTRTNLEKALAQAGALLKGQKVEEATALLTKIRDGLKKALANSIPEAPTAPDPKTLKLAEMLKNYQGQLAKVSNEGARKAIEDLLKQAAQQIRSKEIDAATATLIKARDALKAGIVATQKAQDQAKEQQQSNQEPPKEAPLSEAQEAAKAEWVKTHNELHDKVTSAITKGLVVDVDECRKLWEWSVNQSVDLNFVEALKNVPTVRKMLQMGTPDGKSAFNEDIPHEVKQFAESRVRWSFARSKMQTELDTLTQAILTTVEDDEDLSKQVKNNIGMLTDYLVNLDARLEDKLDQIVNEKSGTARDAYKLEAQKLIGDYRKELEADFFKDVDSNSGFGNVAILATAQNALGAIETVLR